MTKEGIPLSVPKPFCCTKIRAGTTTAGDTADNINLKKVAYVKTARSCDLYCLMLIGWLYLQILLIDFISIIL